ncbi:MAG TPA: PleD family two-component system response regulator [Alphaproteobacteria bacterium]|nr:PleD family two-component system response regulator [Alphaproteobacteria bacterium]
MTGKVLVIDDLEPNLRLLEAKLKSEYYTVYTATNGYDGIKIAKEKMPDIILLDVMMPQIDGFTTCKKLKEDEQTAGIPIVMVTALTEQEDRVKGLNCGADDFITKPIDEFHLFVRVRSLIRIKELFDELKLRDITYSNFGGSKNFLKSQTEKLNSKIILIDDDVFEIKKIKAALESEGHTLIVFNPDQPLEKIQEHDFDLVIVNTLLDEERALRMSVEIKGMTNKKRVPIIILVDESDKKVMLKGLQIGIDDYVLEPLDINELLARTRTLLRRKKYQDSLRHGIEDSINASVIDQLTKLYNRRYLETHLGTIFEEAKQKKDRIVLLTIDIDNFKKINDRPGWGHSIGDEVLKEVADRIKQCVRDNDLAVRHGGEEFIAVLTNTTVENGTIVAERIRKKIADTPIKISVEPYGIDVTVSIGDAVMRHEGDSPEDLINRSDEMLYKAKTTGKNKVVSEE